MLMTDDTGWNDFGAYGGGQNFGHPTPNIAKVAQEGAAFRLSVCPSVRERPLLAQRSPCRVPVDRKASARSRH
jgi:hypothetical protein